MFNSRAGSSNLKLALAQEFKTLSSLRHPHIVSVRDYGFDTQKQPFFTMDLLKNAQTIVEAGRGKPQETQIDLLLQLLQALAYLHRRGVLHRDLKPGNIMVVDGQVKVLDFGLSLISETSVADISHSTVGTFAYMAPELIQGEPPSRRSDLYAVGMIAYEIFAGEHPFDSANLALLISQVLNAPIDFNKLGSNTELAAVIQRLLDRSESNRYRSVAETIRAFCEATDTPLPAETREIRESYLQAAKFVGREEEMATLTDALKQAHKGKGSAWLVGGESGVGKTRLFDELQTLAMVEGVTVLRGQALSEGGAVFQSWIEPLRILSLSPEITDEQAAAFKPIVSDIEHLIGYPIPDLQTTDALTSANLFFNAIAHLVTGFGTPILLLLEDLHWASSADLTIFSRLVGKSVQAPVLMIGNYRDDEVPTLPEQVPDAALLRLRRLDEKEIENLSTAILGQKIGRNERVLDLLRRETEGNPFFLVEITRELAETAGKMDAIDAMELPERIFAQDVQDILRARLDRVPKEHKRILEYAALIGRQLDMPVLEALFAGNNQETWVLTCADLSILEYQPGGWRFAHDKLREEVITRIDNSIQSEMHGEIAAAIEREHPDEPDQYTALALHWGAAKVEDKERRYAGLAGKQAFQNSAFADAIALLERALTLLLQQPPGQGRNSKELDFRLMLGSSYSNVVGLGSPEILEHMLRVREFYHLIEDADLKSNLLDTLSTYYFIKAEFDSAIRTTEENLTLGQQENSPLILGVTHNEYALNYHTLGRITESRRHAEIAMEIFDEDSERKNLRRWGFSHRAMATVWLALDLVMLGYPDQGRRLYKQVLERIEKLNFPYALALLYQQQQIYLFTRDHDLAEKACQRLLSISAENNLTQSLGYGLFLQAQLNVINHGNSEEIEKIKGVLRAIEDSGDFSYLWLDIYLIEAQVHVRDFHGVLETANRNLAWIEDTGIRVLEAEIYRHKADSLLELGSDHDVVEAQYLKAIRVARGQKTRWWELRATVGLARLLKSQGRIEEAREQLAAIYSWFTEGFDTQDMLDAKKLLDELEVSDYRKD